MCLNVYFRVCSQNSCAAIDPLQFFSTSTSNRKAQKFVFIISCCAITWIDKNF